MEKKRYEHADIEEQKGIIPVWLLIVYSVLALWGIYYLIRFWGGLGPGMGY